MREDKTGNAMDNMKANREAGLELMSKVEDTIRRAARAGNDTYFTKS